MHRTQATQCALALLVAASMVVPLALLAVPRAGAGGPVAVLSPSPVAPSGVGAVTVEPGALAIFDHEKYTELLDGLAAGIIGGGAHAGIPAVPGWAPPSIKATYRAVEAFSAAGVPVPAGELVGNWLLSTQDPATGLFVDEYSTGHQSLPDGGHYYQPAFYSPVAATGMALAALSLLGRPVPGDVASAAAAGLISRNDAASGGFTASPGDPVPYLSATAWALDGLERLGAAGQVDAGAAAGFVASLRDGETGLYADTPSLSLALDPALTGHSLHLLFLARKAFGITGYPVGTSASTLRDAVMARYTPGAGHFAHNPYKVLDRALATASALRVLEETGYPQGFTQEELPAVLGYLAGTQLPGGAWAYTEGVTAGDVAATASVVTAVLAASPGHHGAIDVPAALASLEEALVVTLDGGKAGFSPLFPSQPPSRAVLAVARVFHATGRGGAIDPAVAAPWIASLHQFHSFAGRSAPRFYIGENPATVPQSGVQALEAAVELKRLLGLPFTQDELAFIHYLLDESQVAGVPGLSGLHAVLPTEIPSLEILAGQKFFAVSLENSAAVLRAIGALSDFGGGGQFTVDGLVDTTALANKVLAGYREAAGKAWFEREWPLDAQARPGPHDPALETTRLSLEILSRAGALAWPSVLATVSFPKLAAAARDVAPRTARDVDNAVAVLSMAGEPVTPGELLGLLSAVVDPASGMALRAGVPNLEDTCTAAMLLRPLAAARVTVSGEGVGSDGAVAVTAGGRVGVSVERVGLLTGPLPGAVATSWLSGSVQTAPVAGASVSIGIPLSPSSLGASAVLVAISGVAAGGSFSVPVAVSGRLVVAPAGETSNEGGHAMLSVGSRDAARIDVDVYLAGENGETMPAPGASVALSGPGTSRPMEAVPGTGGFTAAVELAGTAPTTTFSVTATHLHCEPATATIVVRLVDGLTLGPYTVIPVALGAIGAAIPVLVVRRASSKPPGAGGRRDA